MYMWVCVWLWFCRLANDDLISARYLLERGLYIQRFAPSTVHAKMLHSLGNIELAFQNGREEARYLGSNDRALSYFKACVGIGFKHMPDHVRCLLSAANVLIAEGKTDEALPFVENCLQQRR